MTLTRIVALLLLVSAPAAHAGAVDYSALLDAIDFGTIATGVVGAGSALVAVYLAIKGVRLIIGFVRGEGAGSSADWSQGGLVNHEGGGMSDGTTFERYRYADGEEHEVTTRDRG